MNIGFKLISSFLTIAFLIFSLLITVPAFAQQDNDDDLGGEGYGEKALLLELEVLNLSLFGFLVILMTSLIMNQKFYKTNVGWIYFLFGIILYGLTRLFYILSDQGIIPIADDALEVWWHLIFYNSLVLILLSIKDIMRKPQYIKPGSLKRCLSICMISTIFAIFVFLLAVPLDEGFVSVYSDTFWAKIGIQHLIALGFSSLVAFTLIEIRSFPEQYNTYFTFPLLTVFVIFVSYHFWELLTESLEIIVISEEIVEQTEQVLVVPIFVVLIFGIMHLKKSITKEKLQ